MSTSAALEGFYDVPAPDAFLAGIMAHKAPSPREAKGYGGIDPGTKGATAIISADGRRKLALWDTPMLKGEKGTPAYYDVLGMYAIAEKLAALCVEVTIEKQQPMHGKGTSGEQVGFGIGFGYGLWIAALLIAHVRIVEMAPISWKTKARVMPPRPAKGELAKLTAKERQKRTAANREESSRKVIELASTTYENVDFYDLKRTSESETASPDRAVALVLAGVGRREHLGLAHG